MIPDEQRTFWPETGTPIADKCLGADGASEPGGTSPPTTHPRALDAAGQYCGGAVGMLGFKRLICFEALFACLALLAGGLGGAQPPKWKPGSKCPNLTVTLSGSVEHASTPPPPPPAPPPLPPPTPHPPSPVGLPCYRSSGRGGSLRVKITQQRVFTLESKKLWHERNRDVQEESLSQRLLFE